MEKKYFNSQDARSLIGVYGFAIFPVHGVYNSLCTCGDTKCTNVGKHPATMGGFKDASTDIDKVIHLWQARKHLNVGIATGEASGVFVIDIDSAEGERALNALCELPDTLSVNTGKGKHLYFKHPGEAVITKRGVLEGVDVRGDGGYVVGPGAHHRSGATYEFVNPLEVVAVAPTPILDMVVKSRLREKVIMGVRPKMTGGLLSTGWSLEDIMEHLSCISPDIGYDEWIKVGMALQAEGQLFEVWDSWSAQGTKYLSNKDTAQHWKSFRPGGGVSYGTIVKMAQDGGWKPTNAVKEPALTRPKESVNPETGEITAGKYKFVRGSDMEFKADANDFVQGVLERGAMSVVYGESNCGKTFFMSDLAFHVAEDRDWRERRVEGGGVLYVGMEGGRGLKNRVCVYKKHTGDKLEKFLVLASSVNFLDPKLDMDDFFILLEEARAELGTLNLIIIDTLARALAGGDENSGQDMSMLVAHADLIRMETGAHVCFIHHSGKDRARGARGHSSLRAAVDTEIEISRSEGADFSCVKIVKQRDMEILDPFYFKLDQIVLGINKYDEEITSCVVEYIEEPDMGTPISSLNPKEKFVYEAIVNSLERYGQMKMPYKDGPLLKCITFDNLADTLEDMGYDDMHNKDGEQTALRATKEIRIRLRDKNLMGFNGGFSWLLSY